MSTADIQLSVVFGGQYSFEKLQSDYEQTDTLARDYIKNKPDLVNFEAETVTAETVIFDENPTGGLGALKLQYSPDEKTLEFGLADGGKLQIGKEMFDEYVNIDTVPLIDGMIVSTAAIPGNRKGIKRTDFTNLTSIRSIVGMVTVGSIAVNGAGRVTTKGIINDLNTNGWAEGSQLWGNPAVLGGWSGNKPTKPQYAVQIGQVVVASATVGSVELNVAKDVKFSDLADVNGSTNLIDDTDTIPKRDSDGIIREITVADIKADFKTDTDALYEPLLGFTPENTANKGQANGYASLGADGLVPSNQLPSFVDDVLEFANLAAFPVTGEQGKIYVALDTNKTYRWSGSAYIYITSGAVDSVAGKTGVVMLVKADVGLANVDNTSDVNKPVSTAQQNALDLKIDKTLSSEITTVGNSETMAVKASDNIWKRITWSNIKATLKTYFETLFVTLTGAQNIAGVKTFTDKPIVPTPTGSTEAANKGYVDSAVVGAMPAATKALLPALAYKTRIDTDLGSIFDLNKLTELYIKNLQLLDSTVFLWSGVAGMKTRTSGSNQFASKLYNMANKVQQFGPELVTNGTFSGVDGSTPAGWTAASNTSLKVSSNRLKIESISAGNSFGYQSLSTIAGKTYHLSYSFIKESPSINGQLFVRDSSTSGASIYASESLSVNSTKTISFTALSNTTFVLMYSSGPAIGEYTLWDNISVKQMDWVEGTNDAVQTTEANQPYVGGVIAPNEARKIKGFGNESSPANSYLNFNPIAFSENSTWSLTLLINLNSVIASSSTDYYRIGNFYFLLRGGSANIGLDFSPLGGNTVVFPYSPFRMIGKNTLISFIYLNGDVTCYVNGIYIGSSSATIKQSACIFSETLRKYTVSQFNGISGLYHYQIHNRALSASEIQAQHDYLRLQIPEIEGIAIGNQYWVTSNYEGVVAGDGSVIQEVQNSDNTHIIPETLNLLDGWTALGGAVINDANTFTASSALTGISRGVSAFLKIGESVKVTLNISTTATMVVVGDSYGNPGSFVEFTPVGGVVNETKYLKWTGSGVLNLTLYIRLQEAGSTADITTFTVEKVGWSQSTALYNAIYAQTSGTAAVKELAALKAAAMWCYYNNDVNDGAIYGKELNGYAIKLLALYPPTGYRVAFNADYSQLVTYLGGSSVAGAKLKALFGGFNNSNSTNESGFSAIAGGRRNSYGTFSEINLGVYIGTGDLFRLFLNASSKATEISTYASDMGRGYYVRLLRNSPVGPNERTITSTTIVSDIASTANSTQIPFGYSVASIRLKTTANLTNIKVELWNNFYSGTPTLVATLITGKTANNTTMVFPVLADVPSLLQDGTLRITATHTPSYVAGTETIVEYNLQKNTF